MAARIGHLTIVTDLTCYAPSLNLTRHARSLRGVAVWRPMAFIYIFNAMQGRDVGSFKQKAKLPLRSRCGVKRARGMNGQSPLCSVLYSYRFRPSEETLERSCLPHDQTQDGQECARHHRTPPVRAWAHHDPLVMARRAAHASVHDDPVVMMAVPNVAWGSYLQLALKFEPWTLGCMNIMGSIMTFVGIIVYKNFLIRWVRGSPA
jgi:hypothetical protein